MTRKITHKFYSNEYPYKEKIKISNRLFKKLRKYKPCTILIGRFIDPPIIRVVSAFLLNENDIVIHYGNDEYFTVKDDGHIVYNKKIPIIFFESIIKNMKIYGLIETTR